MIQTRQKNWRYAAFLSYSHQDSKWAAWVHRSIEHYRPPAKLVARIPGAREKLKPVFRDREELPSAGDLGEKITQSLAQSRALIVVCSPACAASRWANQEILRFKQLHGEAHIFCLVVDGEPGSGDEQECFPPALRFRLSADGSLSDEPVEPIAADVRPGKDGKPLARLKLIAGLLGIGLDDLRQREQQRRNRNLLLVTAASLAGMALTGVLAFTAMVARDDAERRQQQAEALVEFMLGDLKRELGKVGRLDALDATARKAEEYFSELPDDELDDEALAGRAKAYRAIGEIYFDRLEWEQALRTHSKALETNQALYRRNPGTPDFLYDLAQSEFWVGYVHLESGSPADAEPFFQSYLDHSQELLKFDAQNPDWIMEVSYGHSNLAGMYEQTGRLDLALTHASKGVERNRQAAALAPDDPYYREELAGALDWLSRSQLRNGDLVTSAATRREARTIYSQILESDPANRLAQQRLASTLRGEAWALHALGDHSAAMDLLGEALDHFIAVTSHDPTNDLWSFWARDAAVDWLLFELESDARKPMQAGVVELLEAFASAQYADNPLRESRRLLALGVLPARQAESGEMNLEQTNRVQQAKEGLERIVRSGDTDIRVLREVASFYLAHPQLDQLPVESQETVGHVLNTLTGYTENTNNPFYLSVQAELAITRGEPERARHSINTLVEMGYNTQRFRKLLASQPDPGVR